MLCRDQYDPDAPLVKKQVLETFAHQTDAVRVVAIEDAQGNVERLTTTDDHPFWVDRIGWVAAADLATGTVVTTVDGRTAIVVENYRQLLDSPAWVYNLEVADGHTYFVEDGQGGQSAIWVHNKCALGGAYNAVRKSNVGGQVHHMIADAISPFTHGRGPSIWMETADHLRTGSWGRAGAIFRETQENLISQKKTRDAMAMAVRDVRSLVGSKYNEGLKEMLEYFKTLL